MGWANLELPRKNQHLIVGLLNIHIYTLAWYSRQASGRVEGGSDGGDGGDGGDVDSYPSLFLPSQKV